MKIPAWLFGFMLPLSAFTIWQAGDALATRMREAGAAHCAAVSDGSDAAIRECYATLRDRHSISKVGP